MSKYQVDTTLGEKVREHLIACGKETPVNVKRLKDSDDIKIAQIKEHFASIMEILGLDLEDDSLNETPKRVAKMYVQEFFKGLDYANFPKCTTVENKMHYDEMVLVKNIKVISNCEHHFVVIDGAADVAYIPKDKVLGLSKINRLVDFFAKRPQIQERLAEQIFEALRFILGTDDIAVRINAVHYCVKARGVQDITSSTVTSRLGGRFKSEDALRQEFLKCAE